MLGIPAVWQLGYQRSMILSGEWWRIVSSTWVHLNQQHLLRNLAGLGLIWIAFAQQLSFLSWCWVYLACTLFTGLGTLAFHPEISNTIGLSGVLHGLIVVGALVMFNNHRIIGIIFLLIVCSKLVMEQYYGRTSLLAGGHIDTTAHLYGAISGVFAGLALLLYRFIRRR